MAKIFLKSAEGLDLSGQDLRDADFSHTKVTFADFSRADLRGVSFVGAGVVREPYFGRRTTLNLRDANLEGANLTRAWLHGADLRGASLRNAVLFDAALVGADLRNVDLTGADLRKITLVGHDAGWRAKLHGARLADVTLTPQETADPTSGFLELASADGLGEAEFRAPSVLLDYLTAALEYAHREDASPEGSQEPALLERAVDQIRALAQVLHTPASKQVYSAVRRLDASLLARLKQDPSDLATMNWRLFEELVAELLMSFGWEVQLTAQSADGGYDLFGISSDTGTGLRSSWIVECKRYASGRPVGVGAVRALYGVKANLGVANALLAATTRFTRGASQFAASRYDLHLADLTRIGDWLNKYQPPPGGLLHVRGGSLAILPAPQKGLG